MQISFFEEFPTTRNPDKLTLLNWPTKLYLAASSLQEFEKVIKVIRKRSIRRKNIREFIYWPILTKGEGYWISPFSQRKALIRIFQELASKNVPVMLDLELPTTQNPLLYLSQLPYFCRNKMLIRDFISNYRGEIYLAEYYLEGKLKERILQFLGLHYQHPKIKIIKMLYHSLHPFKEEFVKQELKRGQQEYGRNFLIAYGTMGTGIQQTEPNLSTEQLENDVELAEQAGIKEVIIYRLGGLNKEYTVMLAKFAKK